jgi:type II secretory pathway pseudopilin PulG
MSRRRSTMVEVTVVLAVLGALLAIGTPSYVDYAEQRREAQCADNRRALEDAERACARDNDGEPCLRPKKLVEGGYLRTLPTCASGGTYVWIVTDPADPTYPKIGCSKHFFPERDRR